MSALSFIAGAGIIVGVILVIIGVTTGNGNIFDGPDLADIVGKITFISLGTAAVSAGFLSLIGALVLSGVSKLAARR